MPPSPREKPIAIVADDEPAIRQVVSRCLQTLGYSVFSADSGRSAHELVLAQPCDLLVTDIVMPEMDGIELIMKIRQDRPEVRILAMSGGGSALTAEYCTKTAQTLGADVCIAKPFSAEDFIAAVRFTTAE